MNTGRTLPTSYRHTLLLLLIAAALALSVTFGAAALSELTGIELVSTAYACQSPSGGC